MQLSFDIDGSLPEVAAACVAGDESGQNRDLAPRAVVAESNETASNQADIPLTGAFDAKGAFGATPSPHPRGNPRAATSHSRPPAGVTGRLKGMIPAAVKACCAGTSVNGMALLS